VTTRTVETVSDIEAAPASTSSIVTRVIGTVIVAGAAAVAYLAFVVSGPDTELGETVRLLYVHVPAAITTYLACAVTFVASIIVLWKRSRWWDLVGSSAAEIGALFAGITLATGMIWGKPTWGTYWQWDARLTSTAMLLLLLIGYLAIRRTISDPVVRARRSAIVGLVLIPNVVLVNRSVEWWRTLHQKTTFISLDPTIDGWQLFTFFAGMALMTLVFVWLLIHRFRLGWLQEEADAIELDQAIAERRAETDDARAPRSTS
jgi:heme exporter protein C